MRSVCSRFVTYVLFAAASGAITGWILTSVIYLLTFWIPLLIKLFLFVLLICLFLLHELNWINLKLPERKWQVPSTWLTSSPKRNMLVWGSVLGSGVWTHNPYTSLSLLYLYIGFLKAPYYGLLFGAIFGLCRTVPSLFLAILRKMDLIAEHALIHQVLRKTALIRFLHSVILLVAGVYLISWILGSL